MSGWDYVSDFRKEGLYESRALLVKLPIRGSDQSAHVAASSCHFFSRPRYVKQHLAALESARSAASRPMRSFGSDTATVQTDEEIRLHGALYEQRKAPTFESQLPVITSDGEERTIQVECVRDELQAESGDLFGKYANQWKGIDPADWNAVSDELTLGGFNLCDRTTKLSIKQESPDSQGSLVLTTVLPVAGKPYTEWQTTQTPLQIVHNPRDEGKRRSSGEQAEQLTTDAE